MPAAPRDRTTRARKMAPVCGCSSPARRLSIPHDSRLIEPAANVWLKSMLLVCPSAWLSVGLFRFGLGRGELRGAAPAAHGLFVDRGVVDRQQFFLVEDHFFATGPGQVKQGRQLDRIDRTGLFAHPAVNAAQLVDHEAL